MLRAEDEFPNGRSVSWHPVSEEDEAAKHNEEKLLVQYWRRRGAAEMYRDGQRREKISHQIAEKLCRTV